MLQQYQANKSMKELVSDSNWPYNLLERVNTTLGVHHFAYNLLQRLIFELHISNHECQKGLLYAENFLRFAETAGVVHYAARFGMSVGWSLFSSGYKETAIGYFKRYYKRYYLEFGSEYVPVIGARKILDEAGIHYCPICVSFATVACTKCSRIYYCSLYHKDQDWKDHQAKCKNLME